MFFVRPPCRRLRCVSGRCFSLWYWFGRKRTADNANRRRPLARITLAVDAIAVVP
jgi:hypothetical protein